MAEPYTPSLDEVRINTVADLGSTHPLYRERLAQFDRWLAAHDEAVRAEEREKAAQIAESAPGTSATGYYSGDHQAGYQEAQNWIADRIREQGKGEG